MSSAGAPNAMSNSEQGARNAPCSGAICLVSERKPAMTEKLNSVARAVIDGPHVATIATSNVDGRPQSSAGRYIRQARR